MSVALVEDKQLLANLKKFGARYSSDERQDFLGCPGLRSKPFLVKGVFTQSDRF
jgi:hypothetical protein